jgi:alpha-methylacyl-CoA racemase
MSKQRPLQGVRVVEFEGIGPGPLAGLILAGMGAEVTVIARPNKAALLSLQAASEEDNPLRAGKRHVAIDLKSPDGVAQALDLLAQADALIEGNRPGVMERLGLGPVPCMARNPGLVYGRMTGWGQTGPLAQAAGHDLNYVALTGLLSLGARRGGIPMVPPTVVGDAAGALGLALGIACALVDVRAGGQGRVVDAAIVDVVSMLGMLVHWMRASGNIDGDRPSAFHDSPYYDVYECADGKHITIGALEPQFYALLLHKLGMDDVDPRAQDDRSHWPALKARFAARLRSKTRDQWCELLEGTDVCFAPVLTLGEAIAHPHNVQRGNFQTSPSGVVFPKIAPRFA